MNGLVFLLLVVLVLGYIVMNGIYVYESTTERYPDNWYVNKFAKRRQVGFSIVNIIEGLFFLPAHLVLMICNAFIKNEDSIFGAITKPRFFKKK